MTQLLPAMNHKVLQMAYVVNDIEEAAQKWVDTFGVGPFYVMDPPDVQNAMYRGAPQKMTFRAALAQAGDIHIELIQQHCDSPSCYRDLYPKGQEGFHHVGVIVDDYAAEVERYTSIGFEVANSGKLGPLDFCYVDTSAVTGGMIELIADIPFIHNYFGAVRRAAENWDGSDPIRSANDLNG